MKKRLKQLCDQLSTGLIERQTPLRLALLAALSGEHLLLLGPPGTAKSELARRLQCVFSDGQYFERLLTRFTVPEELFGPLSIKALEQDRYERLTEHYLPSASIAFIDEIFKANSAILNALLTLLNEREFDNGTKRLSTPLVCVIGASNELPQEAGLDALYDRFLLRYEVKPVSDAGFDQLLSLNADAPCLSAGLRLSQDEVQRLQTQAQRLPLTQEVAQLLKALRGYLQQQRIYVSDRRWRKIIKLLKVAAYSNGQDSVQIWDCALLAHCVWHSPQQQADIAQWYAQYLGADAVLNPQRLQRLSETWQQSLEQMRAHTTAQCNAQGEALYRDEDGELTTEPGCTQYAERDGQALYLAPPDQADRANKGRGFLRAELEQLFFDDFYQQCHIDNRWVSITDYVSQDENRLSYHQRYRACEQPTCYSAASIQAKVNETQSLLNDITAYSRELKNRLSSLEQVRKDHLWIDLPFAEHAREILLQNRDIAAALALQMRGVRDGFQTLPCAP